MATVSVIIPVLNCKKFIGQSIRSVLEQTYHDFEIIVVDGGSTDGTLDEIAKFRDNVTLIRSKRGTAFQKNLGVRAANGEFIAFLDADDFFLPEKLKITIKFLEENPSFGLVYSDSIWCDEKGKAIMLSTDEWKPESGWVFKKLLKSCFISTASVVVYRKDALIETGLFDVDFIQSSDYELWLRMSTLYPIGYLGQPLVKHRIWEGNVTKNKFDAYIYRLATIHQVLTYCNTSNYNNIGLDHFLKAFLYFQAGYFFYYLDKIKISRRWFLKSLYMNPFYYKTVFFTFLTIFNINGDRYQALKKSILDSDTCLKLSSIMKFSNKKR